ncbi:unnamed protein product [Menidia menidia]|uniref:(Atlantic silverside) hypothetical protein n=1 Tax=Menidia menidia TaxID=238744 RepID=A0A8S4BZI9_9TELE|nr:unnamed protein product [Menidia menidia]
MRSKDSVAPPLFQLLIVTSCVAPLSHSRERRSLLHSASFKGIGLAIVRALCTQFQGDVYLTARDVWRPRLSPLLALCVFLVCERHRGGASPWFPYIDLLPPAYTCPAYFCHQVTAALPKGVRQKAEDQREAVRALHSSNREFFS